MKMLLAVDYKGDGSELLSLRKKYAAQEEELRLKCKHPKRMISIRHDRSSIGCGSLYGAVVVTCRNCGTKKVIWELTPAERKRVKKQVTAQGFRDERLGGYARYDWELEEDK